MALKKISRKVDCISLNCAECCKRYWITVLPSELKKQARLLKLSEKKFVEKYCSLHLNLFPVQGTSRQFSIPSVFLPKKIVEKISEKTGLLLNAFLALPSIAFKRNAKGECIFLSKNLCKIYSCRPRQCKLFPFISLEKKSLKELYPFCKALEKGSSLVFSRGFLRKQKGSAKKILEKKHLLDVSSYFNSVAKKGFENVWCFLPKQGVVCLENNFVCKISRKDFLKIINLN